MKNWVKKSRLNIIAYNKSLSPEDMKSHAHKAGKASWAKLTEEQRAAKLKKMRDARK
jgi:hypothetical protein